MKKFDGLHPYAYDTIFGIINIDEYTEDTDKQKWYVVTKVTETAIQYPTIIYHRMVGSRRFHNRTQAYQYIKKMERTTYLKILETFVEVGVAA